MLTGWWQKHVLFFFFGLVFFNLNFAKCQDAERIYFWVDTINTGGWALDVYDEHRWMQPISQIEENVPNQKWSQDQSAAIKVELGSSQPELQPFEIFTSESQLFGGHCENF